MWKKRSTNFRQIPPVVPHGYMCEVVQASMKRSKFWNKVKFMKLKLTTNMRIQKLLLNNEPTDEMDRFSNFLLEIGEGRAKTITISDKGNDFVQIPKEIIVPYNELQLINEIYPNITDFISFS